LPAAEGEAEGVELVPEVDGEPESDLAAPSEEDAAADFSPPPLDSVELAAGFEPPLAA